jgi:hypothetical protein
MKEFKGVGDAVKYYVQQRDRLRRRKRRFESRL